MGDPVLRDLINRRETIGDQGMTGLFGRTTAEMTAIQDNYDAIAKSITERKNKLHEMLALANGDEQLFGLLVAVDDLRETVEANPRDADLKADFLEAKQALRDYQAQAGHFLDPPQPTS